MSGFIGILERDGAPVERDLLGRLTRFLTFRGPDGWKTWTGGHAGLGHALWRADADPLIVAQPLALEDRLWVVADARLDDRATLVERVRGAGRAVTTATPDAALLLHAYDLWEDACIEHLLGDFSFCIWDAPRRRLFCAVDHLGIRPLYYASLGDTLVVGNTLHAVRLHPKVSTRLNAMALGDYLLFGRARDRDTTIDADIVRLPPAHTLAAGDAGLSVRRYWTLPEEDAVPAPPPREVIERFTCVLDTAVSDRLRVNRAAFSFSGGLDSTLVAASARRVLLSRNAAPDLSGYTVYFDHLIPDSERAFATMAADALGVRLEFHPADSAELFDWTDLDWMIPEPLSEPRWGLGVRIQHAAALLGGTILTGWDGDTVLKASLRAHWARLLRRRGPAAVTREVFWHLWHIRRVPQVGIRSGFRRRRDAAAPRPLPNFIRADLADRPVLAQRWAADQDWPPALSPRGPMFQNFGHSGWEPLFRTTDPGWTTALTSESHPLMDLRVVQLLGSLPAVPWCIDKELSRRCLAGLLPPQILERRKAPLAASPVSAAIKRSGAFRTKDLHPVLIDILDPAHLPQLSGRSSATEVWSALHVASVNVWLGMRDRRGAWNTLPTPAAP